MNKHQSWKERVSKAAGRGGVGTILKYEKSQTIISLRQEAEDENRATFYVSGKMNKHHARIWGTEKPYEVKEHKYFA